MSSYTPGAFRVGPCSKCGEIYALKMPAQPGVDVDALLDSPRECPKGYHTELSGWSNYYWPWRRWAEVQGEEAARALAAQLHDRHFPPDVREKIGRGLARLDDSGEVVPIVRANREAMP